MLPPKKDEDEEENCTARLAAVASPCSSAPLAAPFAAGDPPSRAAANSERRQAISASPCGTKCSAVAAVSRAWTTQSWVEGAAKVTNAAVVAAAVIVVVVSFPTGISVAAATNLATTVPSVKEEELPAEEAQDSPCR